MSKPLYEIVANALSVAARIAENNGEIPPDLELELSTINLNLADKVDGYDAIMARCDQEAISWKLKADEFTRIARTYANIKERLKEGIKNAMHALGKEEIEGGNTRFKLCPSKASLEIDESKIDGKYVLQVISTKPDKERIRDLIEMGEEVTGARLVPGFSLRSYPRKK